MMRRNFIPGVMGGILVLLLAGWAGAPGLQAADPKTPPPAAQPGGPGASLATPVPPPAALQQAPTYVYNAAGKADPFRPFMETDPAVKAKKKEEPKKTTTAMTGLSETISPLQKLDIGQFRLVGIAGDQKKCVAIVEDGVAKRYYPLFVGTHIGLNGGRVAAILPDRVIVEEKAGMQAKKVKIRRVTVMLHKEDEGKP